MIDPIDGTSNFVKGIPVWATLIALRARRRAGGRAWRRRRRSAGGGGRRGAGAPTPTASASSVSSVAELADAHLAHAGVGTWFEYGRGEPFVELTKRVWRAAASATSGCTASSPRARSTSPASRSCSLWDLAALQVIVEEAGGRFTDLAGVARPDGGSAVSTNGLLHDEVLAALASPRPALTAAARVAAAQDPVTDRW